MDSIKGYVFSLVFCLATASSLILIHKTDQLINPYLAVFLTFVVCALWFNLINCKSLKFIYRQISKNKSNVFIINLTTAVNWIAAFKALEYLEPVLYISIFMGFLPVITYFIKIFRAKESFDVKTIGMCLSILILLFAIILISKNSVQLLQNTYFWKGVILTFISSSAGAVYMLVSKETETSLNLSPTQVVSIRFYLLLLYAGFISCFNNSFPAIHNINYTDFLILALVSSILPVYTMQKSISLIGGLKTSFVVPFTPVFTYFLLFALHQPLSKTILPFLLVLSLLLFFNSFYIFWKTQIKTTNLSSVNE